MTQIIELLFASFYFHVLELILEKFIDGSSSESVDAFVNRISSLDSEILVM